MTANITQYVIPRHRRSLSGARLGYRGNARHLRGRLPLQSGRITHTTITAAFGVSTLVMLAVLGFFYLQQVLHTASEGTDIHALESQLIDLKQQRRELELEGAQLRSLQTVEEHVQKLNLAPTGHVTYLAPAPDHVAALPR